MKQEDENGWNDRRNRKRGVCYGKDDPRVIVPKRLKGMGWTVHFARPGAIPVMLLLIAIIIVPQPVENAEGAVSAVRLLTGAAAITRVCVACAWLSSRRR